MKIEVQVTSSLLFLVLAILIGSLSRWILTAFHGYKPPVSVIWFGLGVILAILEISISHQRWYHGESILDENEDSTFAKFSIGIAQFARLKPESAYLTLLPILLYDATQQQSWYYFKRVLSSGILLATAGILIQIAFLSVLVRYTFPGLDSGSDQSISLTRNLFDSQSLPQHNFLQIEKLNQFLEDHSRNQTLPMKQADLNRNLSEMVSQRTFSANERAWRFALLTATTVSSTDPIAVISVLEEMEAPHKFSALVDCEALINDGTALFVYSFLKELFDSGGVTFGKALWMFLRLSCLGPLLGFIWAAIVYRWLIRFQGHPLEQTLVVVCNGYGIFLITDVFLKSSGPLTIVVYGLYFSAFAKAALDTETRKVHKYFVSTLATGANMVIFVMSGCVCGRMIWDGLTNQKNLVIPESDDENDSSSYLTTPSVGTKVGYMVLFYIYVQLARLIMLGAIAPVLKKLLSQYTWKEFALLFWSGLRGGVCLLTAMQVEGSSILGNADLRQSATYSTSAALLILIFNATTFSTIYRKLQPFPPNSFRVVYLKKVMALIEKEYAEESRRLQEHWLFDRSSVLIYANQLIPKLDSVVVDRMGLAELRFVDVRKVFNQWTKMELQELTPMSLQTSFHTPCPPAEGENLSDYYISRSRFPTEAMINAMGNTPVVEKIMRERNNKSSINLYLGKEVCGVPTNAYSSRKFSDFEGPLDVENADCMADRWNHGLNDQTRRKEREREMLLIMINAMRHLYQELYSRSFISGTVMKDFSSVADIVSDFAMINFDSTHEKGKWKKCITYLIKGQLIEQQTNNGGAINRTTTLSDSKEIEDWEEYIERLTGFELEWGTLAMFLRGKSEPGRLRRLLCCFTSNCCPQHTDSRFAECVFRLVNWFGPRQTFRALDELQMVVACADVHEEILTRGGSQLDEMLGTRLTHSCKDVVVQAKKSVKGIASQFYKTFPYAMICHAAVCLGNLKIQLLQNHLERGLLLNDDSDKMACVMKKQILRIRKYTPPYAMH